MKEWRKEQSGVMTVDATLSLSFVVILIMLIIDICGVYQAQNYVYHGMLQTSKMISVYSYQLEQGSAASDTEMLICELLEHVGIRKTDHLKTEVKKDWDKLGAEDSAMEEIVKKIVPVCLGGDDAQITATMKRYGLSDGMDSIDFSGTKKDCVNNDLIIKAEYKVQLLWPVFGVTEVTIEQSTRSRMWDKGK